MRTTTAFFAGIGTVVAAIAAGISGGLVIGDIMSPHQPKHQSSEVTRLEQRSAQAPVPARNDATQPVPYLGSSQVAATVAEPAQPAKAEMQQQPAPLQQPQQAAVQPADTQQPATSHTPPSASPQPAATVEPPAGKERAAPGDAFAKARDADLRREPRRAEDRRKFERRQRWAERKRMKARERDGDDLRDVEASVREATEQRPLFGRPSFDSEPRFSSRIGLFDD